MVQPFIGEIRMFGGNFAPLHWAYCYGTVMAVTDNEALFSLIGSAYGGDGRTSFALPDLRGRIPVHQGIGPGLTPRTLGSRYGTETVTLGATEIPAHSHPLQATTNSAQSSSPAGRVPAAVTEDEVLYSDPTDATRVLAFADEAVEPAGGGQAHTNLMPYLCINFIIALQGLYPARN